MDDDTAQRLNALNRAFYRAAAHDFDRTRQTAWPGWRRLMTHLPAARPLAALDAGCGNGRLALFLAESGVALEYVGVDSSPALLASAARSLDSRRDLINADLIEADFIEDAEALPAGPFRLVALFGVLHHVPGAERRRRLIAALAARTVPGGVLAFTAWRFDEQPRFRERFQPPPDDLALEAGDYLLDWRAGEVVALRYCHAVDDAEMTSLVETSGLTLVDHYRADGETSDLNDYAVLGR